MNYSKEDCIRMLCGKYEELRNSGENRFPARKDFTVGEVNAIKSFLGPWPRALEAAGIKEADPERSVKKLSGRLKKTIPRSKI